MGGHRKEASRFIVQNRRATFNYDFSEKFEAGIALKGSEVKSIREGGVGLTEAYASIERGEVWLQQMHVASFFAARAFPHAEKGARKLLLHKKEIEHLERAVMREGYTLIPLNLYFKEGRVKVTLGLGRGKKLHDKRRAIAERDAAMDERARGRVRRTATT